MTGGNDEEGAEIVGDCILVEDLILQQDATVVAPLPRWDITQKIHAVDAV